MTPLHSAAYVGSSEVVAFLLKTGASLDLGDKQVIKPSVKLRQSNIKLFN